MKDGIWVATCGGYPFSYASGTNVDKIMKDIRNTVIETEVFQGNFTEPEAMEKIFWEKKNELVFELAESDWVLTLIPKWGA